MSWSYGAVHEKGLILKENDFKKLLKLSNSFKEKYELANEDIDDMYGGDLQDYVDDFGMYDCYVTVCDLNKLVGFYDNGEAQYDNIETIEDENIFVMWLKKDNLLNSYSGYDEIVKEIENNIVEKFGVGLEVIEKELGKDFIKDKIGLATGFFSDR